MPKKDILIIDPLSLPDNGANLSQNLLDAYFNINASAAYRFKKGSKPIADLKVSVWNLSDRKNFFSDHSNISEAKIEKVLQTGLKLTPNAIFRVYLD